MKPIKKAENMTFTINYSDGEKREIKEGILFSVEGDRLGLYATTNRKEVLSAAANCLMQFIINSGAGEEYRAYVLEKALEEVNDKRNDRILDSLSQADPSGLKEPVIAVYNKDQREYPGSYVARIYDLDKPTNTVILKDSIAELQGDIRMNYRGVFFYRGTDDDPSLIGCWI